MYANPDAPPKWVRWLWEVDASEAAEKQEEGKGLGVGKIVRAGIALADDEGLEGVSVRKLAQRLGVSTMAAYRHISSRDEVIAAMVDVAFGQPPEGVRPADRPVTGVSGGVRGRVVVGAHGPGGDRRPGRHRAARGCGWGSRRPPLR